MKNFLTALIIFMVWSVFGLWIYSWLLPKNFSAKTETILIRPTPIQITNDINTKKIIDTIEFNLPIKKDEIELDTISTETKTVALGLKASNENGDIIFLFDEGIQIYKNSELIEISETVVDFKYKINTYLLEHPNQEVHIYSIYSPKENTSTPNIGIQRASEVEKQLLKIGVPKEKIVLKSSIKDLQFSKENSFKNGIYFLFKPLDLKRIEAVKNNIPTTKIVYPNFTESGITVNSELKILLSELIMYFSNHPNKTIEIVGHTDNIGNSTDNYSVGLKYAQQVRWYLISKGGLKRSLIKASSKGETIPIDNNNTKQGRKMNRRIEIVFN